MYGQVTVPKMAQLIGERHEYWFDIKGHEYYLVDSDGDGDISENETVRVLDGYKPDRFDQLWVRTAANIAIRKFRRDLFGDIVHAVSALRGSELNDRLEWSNSCRGSDPRERVLSVEGVRATDFGNNWQFDEIRFISQYGTSIIVSAKTYSPALNRNATITPYLDLVSLLLIPILVISGN